MAESGTQSTSSTRSQEIELNTDYFIKTLFGRLVLIELVITLICGACSSGTLSYSYCPGHYGFLAFVAWTSFLNLLIFAILKLVGLWDRFRMFWIFPHPIIPVIFYTLAVVGFLIGSCLAASCANRATGSGTAAAVFGFCCLFLFALELFFAFKAFRSSANEARQQAPKYDPEPAAVVWYELSDAPNVQKWLNSKETKLIMTRKVIKDRNRNAEIKESFWNQRVRSLQSKSELKKDSKRQR